MAGHVRRIAQRQRLVQASQADVEATRLAVYYETRSSYRMVLLRMKLVEVRQREVEALEELVRVDGVKLDSGTQMVLRVVSE